MNDAGQTPRPSRGFIVTLRLGVGGPWSLAITLAIAVGGVWAARGLVSSGAPVTTAPAPGAAGGADATVPPGERQQTTAAGPARSVWDGIYTEAQAERGEVLYQRECARCHAHSQFIGPVFLSQWSGRTAHDLFENLRTTMPQDGPGRLGRQGYADVVAYLFKCNKFPPGESELDTDAERLRQIRIESDSRQEKPEEVNPKSRIRNPK